MNKFDNILNINEWSAEELQQAIYYYNIKLNDPRSDDNERRWIRSSIQKCEDLLFSPSKWESLFN